MTQAKIADPKDVERFRRYVENHPWQVAKTMPTIPHSYTLRFKTKQQKEFEWCVMFIREHGYDKHFGRKKFRYYDLDDHQYWSMGAPLVETILINRAKIT